MGDVWTQGRELRSLTRSRIRGLPTDGADGVAQSLWRGRAGMFMCC